MVRFGAIVNLPAASSVKCFNSSMVRFGGCDWIAFGIKQSEFQFQYGAIWRLKPLYLIKAINNVSIPVWCDLERAKT